MSVEDGRAMLLGMVFGAIVVALLSRWVVGRWLDRVVAEEMNHPRV